MLVRSLGREVLVEEGMAADSSILAWRIPLIEEPGGLQSMGRKELDTTEQLTQTHTHMLSELSQTGKDEHCII